MNIQAWALRRMISVHNSVTRRPHVPREKALRRILISQGFDIDLESPPRSGPAPVSAAGALVEDEGESCDEDQFEEHSESECFTDDESVAPVEPLNDTTCHLAYVSSHIT